MEKTKLCFDCRLAAGWVSRDNFAHTARMMECEGCGKFEAILPARHWVKYEKTK